VWHRALPERELSADTAHRVVVDGRAVCLTIVDGKVRAISDVCPHRGASLSDGLVRDGCVTCPSHLWRFDFIDGRKQGDDRTRVATYPVRIVDGAVEVDMPPRPEPRSLRETLLAHARGEDIRQEGTA
jgi:nitrite reductase/ring-hydroxylating ferredoxin subunit